MTKMANNNALIITNQETISLMVGDEYEALGFQVTQAGVTEVSVYSKMREFHPEDLTPAQIAAQYNSLFVHRDSFQFKQRNTAEYIASLRAAGYQGKIIVGNHNSQVIPDAEKKMVDTDSNAVSLAMPCGGKDIADLIRD